MTSESLWAEAVTSISVNGCFVSGDRTVTGYVFQLRNMPFSTSGQREKKRATSWVWGHQADLRPQPFEEAARSKTGSTGLPSAPSATDKNITGSSGMFPVINQSTRTISVLIFCPRFLLKTAILSSPRCTQPPYPWSRMTISSFPYYKSLSYPRQYRSPYPTCE